MTPHRLTAALAALLLFFIPVSVLAQDPPAITLDMTLAVDTNDTPGDECGLTDALEVPEGTSIEVCYTVTNTGDVTLNLHDLEDTELGVILDDLNLALNPDASVFVTVGVVASVNTTFNGTWTAFNAGPTDEAQAMDSATLTVIPASILLEMTLTKDTNGLPGDDCGVNDALLVAAGTVMEVCYRVTNTGQTTLNLHDLEDSFFGTILSAFPYELTPGASVFVTQTVTATSTTTFEGSWTAYNEGPVTVAQSSDSAYMEVVATPVPTVGWWAKVALVLLLMLFSGVYFHGRRLRVRR